MPTKDINLALPRPYLPGYRRWYNCKEPYFTYYTLWSMGFNNRRVRLPEHRVKPDDLIMGMTSQPLAYRHTKLSGHYYLKSYVSEGTSCNNKLYLYESHKEYHTQEWAAKPVTNWQLNARLKIKDNAVNLGTTLVEYRDTVDMFRDFAVGMRNAWRSFKGKSRARRRLTPCDVAAAELTATYGIVPLARDLADSYERLANRLERPIYQKITTIAKNSSEYDETKGYITFNKRWDVSDAVVIYVEITPEKRGFTLGNPAELAWEAVPFSFVADWGIDIGGYLSSLDALEGVSFMKGVRSNRGKLTITSKVDPEKYTVIQDYGYYRDEHERFLITSIPMAEFPSWSPSMSWRRAMNAISLLTALSSPCRNSGTARWK